MTPRHIKATLQYDGTGFAGFQIQGERPTIQLEVERALSAVAGHCVRVTGAGRTDAGVHALGQVISFQVSGSIPTERIAEAANSRLPRAIVIWDAVEVGPEFHPRYAAISKVYSYSVWRAKVRSPFLRDYAYHCPQVLQTDRMIEAAACLEGTHDFRAFRASGSSVKTTVRTVYKLRITEGGPLLRFVVEANGFLYNMVRIMVGSLLEVGMGRLSPGDLTRALDNGERCGLGPTAPAHGLCLEQVRYS